MSLHDQQQTLNKPTDAGVGNAVFKTKTMLHYYAFKRCITLGFLPVFLGAWLAYFVNLTPRDFDVLKVNIVASFVEEDVARRYFIRDQKKELMAIEGSTLDGVSSQYFFPSQIATLVNKDSEAIKWFWATCLISILGGAVGGILFWKLLSMIGKKAQEDKRLRGALSAVNSAELTKQVRKSGNASEYTLAGIPLVKTALMIGINIVGAQGSGKSTAIHDLMKQVCANKRKAVIYDFKGEYFEAHYRPGKDYFFNPALVDSVAWSIFSELIYDYDATTFAQAFLPPKAGVVHGASAFFEDAARALFSVILQRLARKGAVNTSDIARAFLSMPEDEMAHLIRDSIASSAIAGDAKSQRQGVLSSISIYLEGIGSVPDGDWSLRDFLQGDDDSRLFIIGSKATNAMFAPLYRLMITSIFNLIGSTWPDSHEDKFWFFGDEIQTIGDIQVDTALATLRSKGVCIVTGMQSSAQLTQNIGAERMKVVMNCYNTTLGLRNNEPEIREQVARNIGKQEIDSVSQQQQLAVTEWRDGAGINQSEKEKWVVMPDDFGYLKDRTGYIKQPDGLPPAFVDFRNLPFAVSYHSLPKVDGRFVISRPGSFSGDAIFKQISDELKDQTKSNENPSATDDGEAGRVPDVSHAKETSDSAKVVPFGQLSLTDDEPATGIAEADRSKTIEREI